MSEAHPPADRLRFKPYKGPAAGWGALRAVTDHWFESKQPFKNLYAMMKTNKSNGFDCPGCAWGEAPQGGAIKFCENGAKAVNWEATSRRVDAAFFAEHSVSELLKQDDYWLEFQGRLTEPMVYDGETDHYKPISWDDAFALIAKHLKGQESPDEAAFYTSGRASNEAAFLYQLFGRAYGTNNFPDCSNMCHEASGVALAESIGTGKGTVTYEDFYKADALFLFGQNPGTNHPRMLEPISDAVKRGAQVAVFNPLRERGLERFQAPQDPVEMLTQSASPTNTAYFRPSLGGDMAAVRGMVKWLLKWDREALAGNGKPVFDHDFIAEHTDGMDDYLAKVDATSWEKIEDQSGMSREVLKRAAEIHRDSKKVIICWAMGITQHHHSVPTIQEIANLQLLRGQFGEGAGLCPVRGHSNVQGDRTVGIADAPPKALLEALEKRFGFRPPQEDGYNVVTTLLAMVAKKIKVFICLGGNFAQATPDTPRTHEALRSCELTVQISTKLNRSHLAHGREALILPCLGRTDIDEQAGGRQGVTVEDSFSMVHLSHGQLRPLSAQMRSEPAIVAGMAEATLGKTPVDWSALVADYDRIRELIQDTIPGFENVNERLKHPGGFYLGNPARDRQWHTNSGHAQLITNPLPETLVDAETLAAGHKPDLVLTTLRSHDQYNTTIYGLHDRYRGVHGGRKVVFANRDDIERLGFKPGDKIDMVSLWRDDVERRVSDFTLLEYDIPAGQAAAYYPETNPLVPMDSYGVGSYTPTSKLTAIRLEKSTAPARIA